MDSGCERRAPCRICHTWSDTACRDTDWTCDTCRYRVQRDEARADAEGGWQAARAFQVERDEARQVAREIRTSYLTGADSIPALRGLEDAYPWLRVDCDSKRRK